MIRVTLPDGSEKKVSPPSTGKEIVDELLGPRAKDAVAIRVEEQFWDLSRSLSEEMQISFFGKVQN